MDLNNRKLFEIVFKLSQAQPWLVNKIDRLQTLLFEECDNEVKRELVINLLYDFTYLSNDVFMQHVRQLAKAIAETPGLADDNTQIVAMTSDSKADSAQYLIYALKPIFEELGWRKHLHINTHGKSWQQFDRNNRKHKNIILIDEFIGTGCTAKNQVTTLRRVYAEKEVTDINIMVFSVAATLAGVAFLNSHDVSITVSVELRKGISDKYGNDIRDEKLQLMIALESILSKTYEGRNMPSLGYGMSEALYVRENGNTPNNVFPIFWWPFLKDSSERAVLLTRAMADA